MKRKKNVSVKEMVGQYIKPDNKPAGAIFCGDCPIGDGQPCVGYPSVCEYYRGRATINEDEHYVFGCSATKTSKRSEK